MSLFRSLPSPRRISSFLLAGFFMLGLLACNKEPTPEENTTTPPGFTAERFKYVGIGDDFKTVTETIGTPFGWYDAGKERKRYVFSKAKDQKYRYAAYDVVVGADGKVIDKSIMYIHEID